MKNCKLKQHLFGYCSLIFLSSLKILESFLLLNGNDMQKPHISDSDSVAEVDDSMEEEDSSAIEEKEKSIVEEDESRAEEESDAPTDADANEDSLVDLGILEDFQLMLWLNAALKFCWRKCQEHPCRL